MSQVTRVVVVGNGMVGHHFVESLHTLARFPLEIIVIGEETRPAYDRVHLSELFANSTPTDLALATEQDYRNKGIDLRLGTKVTQIDRAARSVTLSNGEHLSYDSLVLATGSFPFVPPIPGSDHANCMVYRAIDD